MTVSVGSLTNGHRDELNDLRQVVFGIGDVLLQMTFCELTFCEVTFCYR